MAGKKLSRAVRKELLAALRGRYARASKIEKGAILDEFVALYRLQPQIRNPNSGQCRKFCSGSAHQVHIPHLRRGRQGVLDRP